ncbi:ankyrin repeat domain-containing protein 17-like isoform X2 [Photinus pyralis]|uniref:K Homology domain-containing protein n=1 Tax=Photinus pyralis TaxID=7054 RepID=A0A1Y1N2D3_PHOPY|nr:ankyrin repeat domain-containing protein 17-like isoform X2 [Photinus pyralis]
MQNAAQRSATDNSKIEKISVNHHDIGNSPSTPHSSNSSPAKSETDTYSERRRFMSDTSESEEDSVSEVESFVIDQEFEEDPQVEAAKFLLSPDADRSVDPETQARLEALLQAAGIGQLTTKDGKLADPEVLRRLTSSVSCALDEAAAALTRMRTDNPRTQPEKTSIVEATVDGDVRTVRKLLGEGRSVHETSEEGESLLSLACSAGYFELAQVLLAMHANVEDRGIKGECTPLMEAASAGHLDIVRLLVAHGADVNAQSSSGNTPLMYGCAGGHTDVVKFLLEHGANVEDHNENGHTPLMEAASAGHVELAKILLMHGAGINTHSNEFKESALTLACYKGHLDMVRFLLEAGADQEHKTDEMHTALMEASMDGHVEVARLLLDSGAQVNMPTDSFESPLTLAACGGHVDLAMLLIERGANIEEVNDEGYTPLMEAAREGHEEMVALLLSQGANINAQTDETQETALTLACCGGFSEVADFLIKAGADIELGASTPLMEAAQEGHLDLVKYLLENNANVRAQTQTGDTALTYACENGHTDVADLLLQFGADLEHESEGGRTPLMKACRAGHLCTVQFLISKGADVNRQTTNNDHTPLSLACAGGHLTVVELLLAHRADPNHKLKDNSTMLIEAAKGGHTTVVQLLLDYPHSMMLSQQGTVAPILPGQVGSRDSPLPTGTLPPNLPQPVNFFQPPSNVTSPEFSSAVLQEVPEAVRILPQDDTNQSQCSDTVNNQLSTTSPTRSSDSQPTKITNRKSTLPKSLSSSLASLDAEISQVALRSLSSTEVSQLTLRSQPLPLSELDDSEFLSEDSTVGGGIIDFIKRKKQHSSTTPPLTDEGTTQKQQILEELHQVERDLHGKQQARNHLLLSQFAIPQDQCTNNVTSTQLPHMLNLDVAVQQQQQELGSGMSGATCLQSPAMPLKLSVGADASASNFTTNQTPAYFFSPLPGSVSVPLSTGSPSVVSQPLKFQTVSSHAEVSQNTAISDRPKAKPAKKEGKNLRKQQYQPALYGQQQPQVFMSKVPLQQQQQSQQQLTEKPLNVSESLNVQGLDLDAIEQESLALKEEAQQNSLLTASILQQFHNSPQINTIRAAFVASAQRKTCMELFHREAESTTDAYLEQKSKELLDKEDFTSDLVEDVVQTLESYNVDNVQNQATAQHNLQVQPYPSTLEESMIASFQAHHELAAQADGSRLEYFVPVANGGQLPVQVQHSLYPYDHYLQAVATMSNKDQTGAIYQAGFQAGMNIVQQLATSGETLTNAAVPNTIATIAGTTTQQYVSSVQPTCVPVQSACSHIPTNTMVQSSHHCQIPCSQHQHLLTTHQQQQTTHQVQAATQTPQVTPVAAETKKQGKSVAVQDGMKIKKGRLLLRNQQPPQQGAAFQQSQNQNYQIDTNSAITQYNTNNQQCVTGTVPPVNYCMDLDSETESNHDTALTLACAGGHEELVELLIKRGADIEHRDKKGFTPLILAATAGHEKVVETLLNNGADMEAQSERTKDTPLSLACSGGRYEVVELLLNRGANREHRNVSDYTPLSLAASGGYVNIIKLLLSHSAEINSRTGSKLGISPLMLAAMNGHTAAVKLLLDKGSDINAQIETNRNTALTLACFQGRHEVVSLLLDRKANVEHRAKTGLTPLMEAASGGYVDVGRVLLDKGADVNATPVPSSRDTALTIAADKGHCRFVELLLCRGAAVEVKNKKGNSPLWLAANGGHLSVVELLYNLSADIDSQDNRKVSCLMAAFRKGHVKVVKWMVNNVTQFPSDQEMIRYISTVSDKELLEKCQECVKIIRAAKETQAAKANKNASILLEELDMERSREESKKAAAARRRERKKKKKLEKREEKRRLTEENKKNEKYIEDDDKNEDDDKFEDEDNIQDITESESPIHNVETVDKEEGDSGIDANSQGSCSSNDVKTKEKRKEKKKKKCTQTSSSLKKEDFHDPRCSTTPSSLSQTKAHSSKELTERRNDKSSDAQAKIARGTQNIKKGLIFEATRHPAERDDFEATGNEAYTGSRSKKGQHDAEVQLIASKTSPKQSSKRDEGWKEVVRKSSVQTVTTTESGVKKVSVPLNAISRVIGRGGSNINAIRGATGAHIEVEKQSKGQGERIITLKGSLDATKQAHLLIAALIKDPDVDILQMLPKTNKLTTTTTTSLWDKTQIGTKKVAGKVVNTSSAVTTIASTQQKSITVISSSSVMPQRSLTIIKPRGTTIATAPRVTAPRLVAQAERNAAAQLASTTKNTMSYTTAIMTTSRATTKIVTTTATQTFAAKLTESTSTSQLPTTQSLQKSRPSQCLNVPQGIVGAPTVQTSSTIIHGQGSPKHHRPTPTASAPPTMQHFQTTGKFPSFATPTTQVSNICSGVEMRTHSPILQQATLIPVTSSHVETIQPTSISNVTTTQEYSLFNSMAQQPTWRQETESHKPINFAAVTGGNTSQVPPSKFVDNDPPPQVDASKAPGYRGAAMGSPVSSKTSSNSTTPPSLPLSSASNYPTYPEQPKTQPLPPIGTNIMHNRSVAQTNQHDIANSHYYPSSDLPSRSMQHLAHSDTNLYKTGSTGYPEQTPINMLNIPVADSQPHLLSSYHQSNSMQHLNYSQSQQQQQQQSVQISATPVSMSRLNPKAPDFSVHTISNKPPQMYNGYAMGNNQNNSLHTMNKSSMNNYHRSAMNNPQQNRWHLLQMQQPFTPQQTELISGMAGMTLHNIARAAGGEILENGGELNTVSNSPAMSPNLPPAHNLHPNDGHYMEDRKQPQPIGTERARKTQNPNMDNNWMMSNDSKMMVGRQWTGSNNIDRYPILRNQMDADYISHPLDSFQHGMPLENPHNYASGAQFPTYLLQQQMTTMRPLDFVPNDPLKMELPQWETSRPNMTDLQEKPHGWPGLTNKWNQ